MLVLPFAAVLMVTDRGVASEPERWTVSLTVALLVPAPLTLVNVPRLQDVNTTLKLLPGLGHYPHLQAPRKTVEEVRAVFDELGG